MFQVNTKKRILTFRVFTLLVVLTTSWIGGSFAGGAQVALPSEDYLEKTIEKHSLDGWGVIGRIDQGVALIDDTLLSLSSFVSYYSADTGSVISPYEFKPGRCVGIRINDKREIIELWLFRP